MTLESFVFSAVYLLMVTSITVTVFRQIGLGSVLGLLVAGLVVGPHTPGPNLTTHVDDLRQFAELGVVLLLFLIGLEIKPARLWKLRRAVLGIGSLQMIVSGLALAACVRLYTPAWTTALLLGFTFALSSTAFVMQILQDRGELASRHGEVAFSVLLLQDLAVVPLLAAVPFLAASGGAEPHLPGAAQVLQVAGMLFVIWASGRFLVPRALDRLARLGNREAFLMVVMLAVFLAAWLTHEVGLSMALGAFIMGMLMSGSRYSFQIQAHIEPYKGLLVSIFFVAIGMSIDLRAIRADLGTFAGLATLFVFIKLVAMVLVCLVFRLPRDVVARVAGLLAQGGEFGFVVLGAAHAAGVIDERTFVLAMAVISVSMLVTPLLVRLGDALADRFETPAAIPRGDYEPSHGEKPVKIVIGGYGRVGRVVATLLHGSSVPFLAFDKDPENVAAGKRDGFPVYFGDVGDQKLLASIHIEKVALVVLTIDDLPSALRAVSYIRDAFPNVPVIARARDLAASRELLNVGATEAYPEMVESSLRLAADALEHVGVPDENVEMLLQSVRNKNYAQVAPPPAVDA
ncbi:MAG: cation:proton antiporter [Gammaproteobacteria bacterium]|nr:cation:proton antiporter [Gammaproteobacteria bacterium]